MDERGGEEEVLVQARVQRAGLDRERRDRDGVLEQPAEVGVMAARACTASGAARRVARASPSRRVDQAPERRVADLAREVLEEAVELVEVAVGDGQERGGVGLAGAARRDRAHVDLQLVAEALDPARDAHEVAALEAPGVEVGVAEDAGRERAAAVAQLDREVRRTRPARRSRSLRVQAKTPATSSPARRVLIAAGGHPHP